MNNEYGKTKNFLRERDEEYRSGIEMAGSESGSDDDFPSQGEDQSFEPCGEVQAPGAEDIQKCRLEAEEYKDRWLRAVAELDNYRKRAAREREDLIHYGNENVLREMILVMDNLERAFSHVHEAANSESIIEGIKRIIEQFAFTLKKFGVESIQTKSAQFDPHFHEAVMQVEAREIKPNSVVEEFQKGYTLNGRLLRPAKVSVAKMPEDVD